MEHLNIFQHTIHDEAYPHTAQECIPILRQTWEPLRAFHDSSSAVEIMVELIGSVELFRNHSIQKVV